jgi:tetratricopeptide (TPR) repeat protein
MLVDVAAEQRDLEAIHQYAPVAEELAIRYDHKLYRGIVQRARGVAYLLEGEYEQAEARFRQALDLFEGLATRWQIGRTLMELGELAYLRGDVHSARESYSAALVHFEPLGAKPDAARAQAALDTLS